MPRTTLHFITAFDGRRWTERAVHLTRREAEAKTDSLLEEPGVLTVRIWTESGYCVRESVASAAADDVLEPLVVTMKELDAIFADEA